uniref:Purple acid phosphatase n=2 Tax=Ascaris TaxID=6251 RepID=A0A9J2PIR3_ASCLU
MYTLRLLVSLLAGVCIAHRQYLDPRRVPSWALMGPNHGPFYAQPEQVALSYGGKPSSMWITWVTFDDTYASIVEYGIDDLVWNATGQTSLFIDGGPKKSRRYIHRVLLTNLDPGTTYIYHVGSEYGWSPIFRFTALQERPEGGFIYAVYGDLGNVNARSLGKIQQQAQRRIFDMVLHVGDMAYNLDTDDGEFGDQFGRQVEPVAAYVPYMTVVGNHENAYNFSHFVNRYTMPNSDHNLFYSFDLGIAHFIAISTEFYYYTVYGWEQIANQWNWLNEDLKAASDNRDEHPWIITLGHRPMYCSDFDGDDCTKYEARTRTGLPGTHAYALEKLFYTYGVDLEIWAHEHSYERMWPLYNRTVYNGTISPYVDPPAPVHIVTGSAGCQENTDPFIEHPPPWSAFRSSNYGFSRMQIFNSTHLYFEQLAASKTEVEDSFWLVKHKHGMYTAHDRKLMRRHGTYISMDYCHHRSHCPNRHDIDKSSEEADFMI